MKNSAILSAICLVFAAGCVQPQQDDALRLVKNDGNQVVLTGLIDATRSTPPERFEIRAAAECAAHGKTAKFESMTQKSTFAFDVAYSCIL